MRHVTNDLRTTHIDPLYGHREPDLPLEVERVRAVLARVNEATARVVSHWEPAAKVVHPIALPPEWEPAVKPSPKPRRKRD